MSFNFNAKEVFEIAVDIEKNGRAFYLSAAEKIENQEIKELFNFLANEEIKHEELFQENLDRINSGDKIIEFEDMSEEYHLYVKALADSRVFDSLDKIDKFVNEISDELDAVYKAIQFEKESILLFEEMKKNAISEKDKNEIQLLIEEEQTHIRKLYDYVAAQN